MHKAFCVLASNAVHAEAMRGHPASAVVVWASGRAVIAPVKAVAKDSQRTI